LHVSAKESQDLGDIITSFLAIIYKQSMGRKTTIITSIDPIVQMNGKITFNDLLL